MTLPSTQVIARDSAPASTFDADTATAFFAGLAERGATAEAKLVRNLAEYVAEFGDRVTNYTTLYDAVDVFFREGGSRAYISRVVGPSPTIATVNVTDGTDTSAIVITAVNAGAWGADVDVVITADGSNRIFTVKDDDVTVEVSPSMGTIAEYVAWAATSDYIRITDGGGAPTLTAATYNVAGGTDDRTNVVESNWETALGRFTKDLGPGHVASPGRTTTQSHTDLLEHAEANNRYAQLDLADTSTVATLTAEVATHRATDRARYGNANAPWVVVPGVAVGTTRTVAPSAVAAALSARSEAAGNSPNVATAGDNGILNYATDLSQDAWTDAQREVLNDGGVNVILYRRGAFRRYGDRTLVNPLTDPAFVQGTAARTMMALGADGDEILERHNFAQIDGKGVELGKLHGDLIGICLPYHASGALYGETPEDSFIVDVTTVNPPEDLAAGELKAAIAVRISPFAEVVILYLTKVANTEAIA